MVSRLEDVDAGIRDPVDQTILAGDPAAPDVGPQIPQRLGFSDACETYDLFVPSRACSESTAPATMVWGDSFAMHLVPGIAATSDVPVVQAVGLIFAVVYIGLNIVADVAGILTNPRLRHPK